ncbi:MAG: hypothetical protein MJA31_04645 [Clostridia bacterium]|nr:hypothetical protein [Clostridia bacterium]
MSNKKEKNKRIILIFTEYKLNIREVFVMIRNNNKLPSSIKMDKRTREIIKKIIKQLELTEDQGVDSKLFYVSNTGCKYLN